MVSFRLLLHLGTGHCVDHLKVQAHTTAILTPEEDKKFKNSDIIYLKYILR